MKKLVSIVLCLMIVFSCVPMFVFVASAQTTSTTQSIQAQITQTFLERVKEDYDLVWSDEFNGDTLDTTKWQFDGQMTRRNSELQIYADSMADGNLQFDGESVIIVPKVETRVAQDGRKYKYTSAEISTQGKQSWKYGYFEIRAKQACGKNIVPAIWTLGYDYNSGTCDWPYSGEIDIMERLNSDKATESTLHHGGAYGQKHHKATGAGGQSYDHKINEEFHNYWLFWTDKYLIIGVDDAMHTIMDITKPELAQSFRTFEHWLIINVAMGMFANPVNEAEEDQWKMWIDYVRIYQLNDDKLYDNYKAFSSLDLKHNGSEYAYGKTVSTLKTESQLDFTITDELEPGKYDVYAEINNVNTTASIGGVETNKITKVDHGKAVGNQAYVGSVDLQDNSAFDISFSGSVTVEKLIFVKTDENTTTPVVVNKDNSVTVSDYFEVSTEDELISATNHLLPGGTIKLKNDITLTKNVQLFNNDIIDLNGKTITVNKGRFLINSEADGPTIKNGNVIISGDSGNFIHTKENNYNAKVKCEDLNITINSTASSGYVFNHNYGAINIEANNCIFTFGERVSSSSSYIISRNAGIYNNCTFNLKGRKAFLMSNGSNTSTRKLYFNNCVVNDALYLFHSDNALTNYVDIKLANTCINNLGALTNFAENTQFVSIADNSVLKQNGETVDISSDMSGNFTMECNHNYVDADCLLPKHCEFCSKSEGKAQGHNIVTDTTPADCLYAGSIKTYCDKCSAVFSEKAIPVLEHNYQFVQTFEPSCTQAGYHLWSCSDCGMKQQRSYNGDGAVIKPAHTYDESQTVVVAPTCTMGGYSLKYCTSCQTQRKTLYKWSIDHDYESIYNEDEGSVTYTCKDCGESYVDACMHQATEGADVVVAPTCTKQGYTEHLCSVCGKTYKDTYVNATGVHKPIESTTQIIAPKCKEQGYTQSTCNMCNQIYKTNFVDELGHTEVIDKGYDATCTEKGLTDGLHCDVCKETIIKQKEIAALGHIEVVTIKGVEPTCTLSGILDEIKCDTCGITLQKRAFAPAKGHEYKAIITKQATCGKAGVMTYKCECGKSYTESIPKTNAHKYAWTVTKKATYFAKGTKSYKCSCGKVSKTTTIKKLVLKKPTVKYTAGKKKIAVKYTKVSGASGFQVRYRLTTSKKWKTVFFKTTKSATKYIKSLTKNKKYYLQTRAYVQSKSKKAYSSWTTRKTIKVK